jgi:uncharacterized membrane protein YgaE (UPF0421/DUF939 family)
MKPKGTNEHDEGLLEYLEDIIGTSGYKEPIEQALTDMDALTETRQERLNRLKVVERDKNTLEQQKKEAEEFLRLKNDHVRAQSRLWQYTIMQCFDNEEKYNTSIVSAADHNHGVTWSRRTWMLIEMCRKMSPTNLKSCVRRIRPILSISSNFNTTTKSDRPLTRSVTYPPTDRS